MKTKLLNWHVADKRLRIALTLYYTLFLNLSILPYSILLNPILHFNFINSIFYQQIIVNKNFFIPHHFLFTFSFFYSILLHTILFSFILSLFYFILFSFLFTRNERTRTYLQQKVKNVPGGRDLRDGPQTHYPYLHNPITHPNSFFVIL